jgi:hypothetical protein
MGIIYDMSNAMYHEATGVSSSAAKTVYKQSVAHWKGYKPVQTPAFLMGSAVHALLLEEKRNLVIKGPKTKASKAFKEMEDNLEEDQMLLTEVQYHTAKRMAKGALDNPVVHAALRHKDRLNEVSIFVECPRTGLLLKTRPDLAILSEKCLYDVKTTQDGSPKGFASECFRYAYDIQAAFYLYTCSLVGWDVNKFKFISIEKQSPFISHMHMLSPELMANATERMHKTLDVIANAEETQDFGTGWGDCSTIMLPAWL